MAPPSQPPTPGGRSSSPSLHICDLHPPPCLECWTPGRLPYSSLTPSAHIETPLILSFQQHTSSSCHTMWWTQTYVLYISRYKAYSIHYTVKYDILCKEDNNHFMDIVLWEKKMMWKYCSCHLVLTFYMCYTQTVRSQICLTTLPTNSARQHMYRFRKPWVLLFPLKVHTNNKQLALVKWNNVFFSFLYNSYKNKKLKLLQWQHLFFWFSCFHFILHRGSGYLGKG